MQLALCRIPAANQVDLVFHEPAWFSAQDPGFLTPGFGPLATVFTEQLALGFIAIPFRRGYL